MTLEDYQRALVSLGFAASDADGSLPGFELYRGMIRARLLAMARVAYRRAWTALGDELCAASFARFLAERPPASPLIREVIGAFAEFVPQDRELQAAAPAYAPALFHFEGAKWRVASAPGRALGAGALAEVDFEGALVLNPTLELVALDYVVSEPAEPTEPDPHLLFVYRRPGEDDVRWYRPRPLFAAIVRLAQQGARGDSSLAGGTARFDRARSLAELLPAALAERGETADEQLLHELAQALTTAVERGVVLGVQDLAAAP